jgi:hypothetical protein
MAALDVRIIFHELEFQTTADQNKVFKLGRRKAHKGIIPIPGQPQWIHFRG